MTVKIKRFTPFKIIANGVCQVNVWFYLTYWHDNYYHCPIQFLVYDIQQHFVKKNCVNAS